MRKTSFKNILITLVISLAMLLSITGCSQFLESIASNQAEKLVEESMDVFMDSGNPDSLLPYINTTGKDSKVSLPKFIDVQQNLIKYSLKNASYKITNVSVNDDRSVAMVTVKFSKMVDTESLGVLVGTEEEIKDYINNCDRVDFSIKLKLVRDEDENWVYSNLDELFDKTINGFDAICILDEEGNPINISPSYMNMIIVANKWYDPLMANPMDTSVTKNPDALVNVFYLNAPVNLSLTASFKCDGEEVYSYDINVNNNINIVCEVDKFQIGGMFDKGDYIVELSYGDTVVAQSEVLTIN